MNKTIVFPALFLNYSTCDIDVYRKREMIADKKFLINEKHINKYQKDVVIVDIEGNVFTQIKKRQTSGMDLWHSIIYLSQIVRVESVVKDEVGFMNLSELKAAILEIIKKKPKKWLPLGPVNVIKEFLDEAKTYKEVMRVFNTKI